MYTRLVAVPRPLIGSPIGPRHITLTVAQASKPWAIVTGSRAPIYVFLTHLSLMVLKTRYFDLLYTTDGLSVLRLREVFGRVD